LVYNILTDAFGTIAPRYTGTLSAVFSALIIVLIAQSPNKFSTIYHRVMCGMSIGNIFCSVAMAFSTLPIPVYGWNEDRQVFVYHGFDSVNTRGTTGTCTAQGFFFLFGVFMAYTYNATLCLYYLCALAFRMKESNIKQKVETFLHGIPILVALLIAVPPIFYQMYNPNGPGDVWCNLSKCQQRWICKQ